ncbi:MAG: hypothetical protein ACTS3F_09945 [Phycisphaerales bacterium]
MNRRNTTRTTAANLLLAAAITLAGATTLAHAQQTPPNPPTPPSTPDRPEAPPQQATPVVKLTQPGQNPRTLRYNFTQGHTTQVRIATDTSVEQKQGQMPAMTQTVPTVIQNLSIAVESVNDDGSASMRATLTGIDVKPSEGSAPGVDAMMRQQLETIVGLEITYNISPRGIVSAGKFAEKPRMGGQAASFTSQVLQTIQNAAIVLPEEPVGTGGQWTTTMGNNMFGVETNQVATFSVASLADDNASVSYTMNVTAEPQKLDSEDIPPGAEVSLKQLKGQVLGDFSIILNTPIAIGTSRTNVSTDMEFSGMGNTIPMSQTLKATTTISKPEAGAEDSEDSSESR